MNYYYCRWRMTGAGNGVKNFDIVYRIDGVGRQCEHNENMLIYSFVKYGMPAMTRGNRIILENVRQLPKHRSNSWRYIWRPRRQIHNFCENVRLGMLTNRFPFK